MPIMFIATMVMLWVAIWRSRVANPMPIKTTGGIRAMEMAIPAIASMISGQKKAKVPANPEKKAIKK